MSGDHYNSPAGEADEMVQQHMDARPNIKHGNTLT